MRAVAPGKLILSGEHAVVYGAPALAVAVQEHITADFIPTVGSENFIYSSSVNPSLSFSIKQLNQLVDQLNSRFDQFQRGELPINQVLQQECQLPAYAFTQLSDFPAGKLNISSTLPVGAGLGSSAALIAAVLTLSAQNSNRQLSSKVLIERVRYCERLQHGNGSMVDAAATVLGGVVLLEQGHCQKIERPFASGGWYRLDSGSPLSTTGECVSYVRTHYADSDIWQSFSAVTNQLIDSLSDSEVVLQSIRHNHRLLTDIGVVPEPITLLCNKIEQFGGAAKICGAGSIRGEYAGQLLCYLPEPKKQLQKVEQLGLPMTEIIVEHQGAHLVTD